MAKRDMKQFAFGALIGVFVAYTPHMFNVDFLNTLTSFIPDMVSSVLKLTATDGFGKILLAGTPSFLSVLLHAVIVGLIVMLMKK